MGNGEYRKPMPYDKEKFEARKKYIMADGYQIATKDVMSRFYDVEEVQPEPPKAKKTTKKAEKED